MSAEEKLLEIFQQVAAIPRASMHEQQISLWLQAWAAQRGFQSQSDQAGNLCIRVPATPGYEKAAIVILQGHLDMVCEKTPDSVHDFSKDPIRCIVNGEWLHADRTTLGADDGVAIALAIALVDDSSVDHPPLEMLFTVEEEVGLGGAAHLQKGFVQGKILLNLDSEKEGVFTVGCAGGRKTTIQLPLSFEPSPLGQCIRICVGGVKGGHSGVDIHKHRASANRLLVRTLAEIQARFAFRLADIQGGSAHNAIARQASATITTDDASSVAEVVQAFQRTLQAEYVTTETSLALAVDQAQAPRALSLADTAKVLNLLQALPHGVFQMSASLPGFVETSNNLAIIKIEEEALHIVSSQRSSVMSQLDEITRQIEAAARLAGAQATTGSGYPAWQPNENSPLLAHSRKIYRQLFGVLPTVETIHAGLECGQIGAIFDGMDMLSIGATIQDPHSPTERLHIPSLYKVWAFLVAWLRSYNSVTS